MPTGAPETESDATPEGGRENKDAVDKKMRAASAAAALAAAAAEEEAARPKN